MNKCLMILLSVLITPTLWASTPTPADTITQLLTKIQSNTANTATATGKTLNSQLTNMATTQKSATITAQTNAAQYVYPTSAFNTYGASLNAQLTRMDQAHQNALSAANSMIAQNLDQGIICQSGSVEAGTSACTNLSLSNLSSVDGYAYLSQANYTNADQASAYVQNLFMSGLASYQAAQLPALTLATGILTNYLEQRMPPKGQTSFMQQLQTMVNTPLSSTWQSNIAKASLSDRVQALLQLTATANYINYQKLQAAQKRNVLAAAAIMQRTQLDNDLQTAIYYLKQTSQALQKKSTTQ